MTPAVFDTNLLLAHWNARRPRRLSDNTPDDAATWARDLIRLRGTDSILTPVYLEFVGGAMNGHEMRLSKAFLDQFAVLDGGVITTEDWKAARRLAERIPWNTGPRPRGAVDCLIKAIALRYKCGVITFDKGMPRSF